MTLGERLFKARKHAGLSQAALAEKTGISQQTISNIEQEIQDKSTDIVQLAIACGVRCEWLGVEQGDMIETRAYVTNDYDAAALMVMQSIPVYAKPEAIKSLDTIKKLTSGPSESSPESVKK